MKPRVSVIVPAYNAAAYLSFALESVLTQTHGDWEIVVVNDGSNDDTHAVVESYRSRLKDRLQYIQQSNRGLPAARNAGIRVARGEFIALLDADDVWLPHRLERSVAALDADPDAGLVHAKVLRIDPQGTITGMLKIEPQHMSGRIAREIYTRRVHIICPTVMFRRSCLETAGWFDEAMFATEDRDLWFRIAVHYNIAFIDEVLAYYRLSPTSMTANLDRLRRGQLQFVGKHYQSGAANGIDHLRALGSIYRELGDALFRGGFLTPAIGSYLRAVGYNPLSAANVYMLFRAIMDPVVRVCLTATRFSNAGM